MCNNSVQYILQYIGWCFKKQYILEMDDLLQKAAKQWPSYMLLLQEFK